MWKSIKRFVRWLLIFIVGGYTLAALVFLGYLILNIELPGPSAPYADASFFVDEDCIDACWQGLRPGETTIQEIEDFFDADDFRNAVTLESVDGDTHVRTYRVLRSAEEYHIDAVVNLDERVLTWIEVYSSKQLDLTLGEIVETIGEPQRIYFVYGASVELLPPRGLFAIYRIYYPAEGLQFDFHVSDFDISDSKIEICPGRGNHVNRATVVIPNTLDPGSIWLPPTGILIDWTGFDCVQLPYIY